MWWARVIFLIPILAGSPILFGADVPGNTFNGKVLDAHGKPLGGTFVSVMTQNGESRGTSQSAADGTFTVAMAEPKAGESRWAIADIPGVGISDFFKVKAGRPALMELQPGTDVPVKVTVDGAPVAGLAIRPVMIDEGIQVGAPNFSIHLPDELSRRWAVKTDANGVAVFRGIDGPAETVHFTHDDERYTRPKRGEPIQTGGSGASRIGTISLSTAATINGTVTYAATGKPAAGIAIDVGIVGQGSHEFTDAQGRYTLKQVDPGRCLVRVDIRQKLDFVATSLDFNIAPGETHLADLSLVSGGLIAGRFTDAITGRGVPGVSVMAGRYFTMTDADGNLILRALAGKTVIHEITPPVDGYEYHPGPKGDAQKEVIVVDGQTVTANFELKPDTSPAFTGTVVDAEGAPVGGATINCTSPANGTFQMTEVQPGTKPAQPSRGGLAVGAQTFTLVPLTVIQADADGHFRIHTAPKSVLRVYFEDIATAQPVRLTDPSVPVTVRLLGAAQAILTVKVTDDTGAPVAGAEVNLPGGMTAAFVLQTGDDGIARFDRANDGINTVWVQAPGYAGASVRLGRGTLDTAVKLRHANSSIEGFVVDELGTPVARVSVFMNSTTGTEETETDANGHFIFDVTDGTNATVHLRGTAAEGMARATAGQTNIKLVMPATQP